jgi:hypothetical protein
MVIFRLLPTIAFTTIGYPSMASIPVRKRTEYSTEGFGKELGGFCR